MTNTSKAFLISCCNAGVLGIYYAATADDAVTVMDRDAGYRDSHHAAEVLETTVEALRANLTITEVDVPAAVAEVAKALVDCDRGTFEDDDGVLTDAGAVDASHWDARGIVGTAVIEAGVDGALARALCEQYLPQIRDAYAKAWRAAVEADLDARDDDAAVKTAIRLESDLTRHSRQDDGSYIIALDDGDDDALARIAAALPPGWQIDWTGDGNTDADGDSTSDAHVWRDEVAS